MTCSKNGFTYRGTSLIRKCTPPLGPPQDPRYSPTGSWQGDVSYGRGTPVLHTNSRPMQSRHTPHNCIVPESENLMPATSTFGIFLCVFVWPTDEHTARAIPREFRGVPPVDLIFRRTIIKFCARDLSPIVRGAQYNATIRDINSNTINVQHISICLRMTNRQEHRSSYSSRVPKCSPIRLYLCETRSSRVA